MIYGPKILNDKAFWPMIAAASGDVSDFPFEVLATDIAGERVAFSMPMLLSARRSTSKSSPRSDAPTTRPSPSGAKPSR